MILNICGTSGSGKTHLVREIMKALGGFTIQHAESFGPWGYSNGHVAVIGKYETACGGCDTIKTQDAVCNLVRLGAQDHSVVIFEGLLVSQIYDRYEKLAKELGDYHFLFLDTPLQTCLDRIKSRRFEAWQVKAKAAALAGKPMPEGPGPLDPSNTIGKWNDMRRKSDKLRMDRHIPVWLDHTDAMPLIVSKYIKPAIRKVA